VGFTLGMLDGLSLGWKVGALLQEGNGLGAGEKLGIAEGAFEGRKLDTIDGEIEGALLGGWLVGDDVGEHETSDNS